MCHFARIFALFLAAAGLSSQAAELAKKPAKLLSSAPVHGIHLESKGRMPASEDNKRAKKNEELSELDAKLKIGTFAIIQNSIEDWNNKLVRVTARYEDGSRQIQLEKGEFARVKRENLNTLSPETTKCCQSSGTDICPGDSVYHPLPTTSLGVPEGKVNRIFENCTVIVRDGLEYIYDASQLGKGVKCSPQKESVCVGKVVYSEGFRNGQRFDFEGPVTQVYTNGVVLVRTGVWLLPIDASSVKVRTESLAEIPEQPETAVITGRDGQGRIPVPTYPELEPANPGAAEKVDDRRGIVLPAP